MSESQQNTGNGLGTYGHVPENAIDPEIYGRTVDESENADPDPESVKALKDKIKDLHTDLYAVQGNSIMRLKVNVDAQSVILGNGQTIQEKLFELERNVSLYIGQNTDGVNNVLDRITENRNAVEEIRRALSGYVMTADLESRLNALESQLTEDVESLGNDLNALESQLTEGVESLENDRDAIVNHLGTMDADRLLIGNGLNQLVGQQASFETQTAAQITGINAELSEINDLLEDKIPGLEGDVTAIETEIERLKNAETANKNSIAQIESDMASNALSLGNSIAENSKTIAALQTSLSETDSKAETNSSGLSELSERVDTIETTANNANTQAEVLTADLQSRLNALESQLTEDVESLGNDLNALESQLTEDVESLQNDRDAIVNRLGTMDADRLLIGNGLNQLVGQQASFETQTAAQITGINAELSEINDLLEDKIPALEGDVNAIETEIERLKNADTTLSNNLDAHETRIDSLELEQGKISRKVQVIETQLSGIEESGTVGSVDSARLTVAEETLANHTKAISAIEQDMASNALSLGNSIAENSKTISALQTSLSETDSKAETNSSGLSELSERVDTIETTANNANTQAETNKSGLESLQGDFNTLSANFNTLNAKAVTYNKGTINQNTWGPNIYVSNYGNDSNDGTETYPFLTIKRALEYAVAIKNNYTNINLAQGDYSENIVIFPMHGCLRIIGNGGDPAAVRIHGGMISTGCPYLRVANISIEYLNQTNTPLYITGNLLIDAPSNSQQSTVWSIGEGSTVIFWSGNSVTIDSQKSFSTAIGIFNNSILAMQSSNNIIINGDYTQIMSVSTNSYGHLTGSLGGNAQGKRYTLASNSMINTFGQGANFIPGTIDGSCDATSTYV